MRIKSMNESQKTTVYTAGASNRAVISHLRDIVRDFPQAHELGMRLFKRNIKAFYRQSLLGFSWALLPPLATAALWIFLRGSNVVTMEDTGIRYPIFVLTGAVLWQIFSEALLAPVTQLTDNRVILSKINIPREGLLLAGAYELLFNIGVKAILLALVFVYFRQSVSFHSLLLVPLGIFAISLAGFSIGLTLTPLGMLYKDVSRGFAVILPFFMYLTPVVYPAPREGMISLIMKWNPLAPLVNQTRNWLTAQPGQDLPFFLLFTLGFAGLFLLTLVVYRISIPMVIERIGS